MNEQQGKHLDRRVRQALDSLPDVPAPNTAFNAGRLWEQLRPELATPPVAKSQRTGQLRWLVAASLAGLGLFLTWLWLMQPASKQLAATYPVALETNEYVAKKALAQPRKHTQPEQKSLDALLKKENQLADRQLINRDKKPVDTSTKDTAVTNVQPALATSNVPAPANLITIDPVPTETSPVQLTSVVSYKSRTTYPKRRFAVVHQNELRAEAETQAKLERNDRFVRLGGTSLGGNSSGTSSRVPVTPAEEKPGLIIPLN